MAKLARTLGVPVNIEPRTAIMAEIARANGAVKWLGDQIAALDPSAVYTMRNVETRRGKFRGVAEQHVIESTVMAIHPLCAVYLQWSRHLVDVCVAAERLGLYEREIRIQEQEAELMVAALRACLDDPELMLTPEQRRAANPIIARHLRLLDAEGSR